MATGAVDLAARADSRAREPGPRTVPARPVQLPGNGRVAALDGIRALAVLAVLAFHGGMPWARGGFLGVDAFFVLSGYLITSLLLTEWQHTGRIAMLAFWARRARRLLPALLLLVLTVALTARYLVPVEERRQLRGDGLAALFYVANWRMVLRGGDYFANTAGPSPLEHTWSLGVEEQFYLAVPAPARRCPGRVPPAAADPGRARPEWGRRVESSLWRCCTTPATRGGPTTAPTPGPGACWSG